MPKIQLQSIKNRKTAASIAVIAIACLFLTLYAASELGNPLMPTPPRENPAETAPIETINSQNVSTQMTEQEALEVASPIILTYTKEHNRIIDQNGIRVTFRPAAFNVTADLLNPQPEKDAWVVKVIYEKISLQVDADGKVDTEYWNLGYKVIILADSREICLSSPLEILS